MSGIESGCGTQIWGQTRYPVYRSGTFNVKRSTLNFQRGDRKGAWWTGYGDRHAIWAPGFLARTSPNACQPVETDFGPPLPKKGDRHGVSLCAGERTLDPPDLPKRRSDGPSRLGRPDSGTDTVSGIESGCGTQIWGQTRYPVYRSGTFNVKRSTLNFQRGDRKGAWWTGYGDRHDVWPSAEIEGQTRMALR